MGFSESHQFSVPEWVRPRDWSGLILLIPLLSLLSCSASVVSFMTNTESSGLWHVNGSQGTWHQLPQFLPGGISITLSVAMKNTMIKSNLRKKRVYFILQLPGHNPSLSEVRTGAEAGTEAENREEHCLLSCFSCLALLSFVYSSGPPVPGGTTCTGWTFLHQLAIKKVLHRRDRQASLMEVIPQLRFPLPKHVSCGQKLTSTLVEMDKIRKLIGNLNFIWYLTTLFPQMSRKLRWLDISV